MNNVKAEVPHKYKSHLGEINVTWEAYSKIHIYEFW